MPSPALGNAAQHLNAMPRPPPTTAHLPSLSPKKTHRQRDPRTPALNTSPRYTTLSGTNANRKSVGHSMISANNRLGIRYWQRNAPNVCVLTSRFCNVSAPRQALQWPSLGTTSRPERTLCMHTDVAFLFSLSHVVCSRAKTRNFKRQGKKRFAKMRFQNCLIANGSVSFTKKD